MQRLLKALVVVIAAAVALGAAMTALAGDLGFVANGDIELKSTLPTFPTDHPNGYPDKWHHSTEAAWSNGTTDPHVSGTHSLFIPDDNAGGLANIDNEHRSFARLIPGFGMTGRTMAMSWQWNWVVTSEPGDMFSANVRTSTAPVISLDLVGVITDHLFLTDGSVNSGGFQQFMTNIPLTPADRSFDIIFRTWDRVGPDSERTATGVMFVDDVRGDIVFPGADPDFDNNTLIDGGDALIWQQGLGIATGATNEQGDANGTASVTGDDLTIWESAFPASSVAAMGAIPEPSTLGLAGWGLLIVQRRRRNLSKPS